MKTNCGVKKKGFTLVEILIVIAIISTVVLLGVSSYSTVRRKIRLDMASSNVASLISEARDKTKSGYFAGGSEPLCFGFRVEPDELIESLETSYNRLSDVKCSREQNDIRKLRLGDIDEDLVIKEIELFEQKREDPLTVFFSPPKGEPEIGSTGENLRWGDAGSDQILKIVVGFKGSEHNLDKREVIFNILTGNVYTQRYDKNNS